MILMNIWEHDICGEKEGLILFSGKYLSYADSFTPFCGQDHNGLMFISFVVEHIIIQRLVLQTCYCLSHLSADVEPTLKVSVTWLCYCCHSNNVRSTALKITRFFLLWD